MADKFDISDVNGCVFFPLWAIGLFFHWFFVNSLAYYYDLITPPVQISYSLLLVFSPFLSYFFTGTWFKGLFFLIWPAYGIAFLFIWLLYLLLSSPYILPFAVAASIAFLVIGFTQGSFKNLNASRMGALVCFFLAICCLTVYKLRDIRTLFLSQERPGVPMDFVIAVALFLFLFLGLYFWLRKRSRATGDALQDAHTLRSGVSTDRGWLSSWFGTKTVKARTDFNIATAQEMRSHGELVEAETDVEIIVHSVATRLAIARLTNEQHLLEAQAKTSFAWSITAAAQQSILSVSNNRIAVIEAASAMALDELNYQEVQKLIELDKSRLNTRWGEKSQDLNAMLIYAHQEYQLLYMMLDYIKGLYQTAEQEEGRAKALTEEHITFMEETYRERKRLLSLEVQKDLGGSDTSTDSGRVYRETMDETQD